MKRLLTLIAVAAVLTLCGLDWMQDEYVGYDVCEVHVRACQ